MNLHFARRMALLLLLVAVSLGQLPEAVPGERVPAPLLAGSEGPDTSEARVIVKYRSDAALMRTQSVIGRTSPRPQHAATLAERLKISLTDGRVLGPRTQGLRGAGMSSSQLAAQLSAMVDVEWAVPDQRRRLLALPNDPFLPGGQTSITPVAGQWYLHAPDSTTMSAINAVGAWDITNGSPTITVAILDTGVLLDHPDLAAKLHPGYDFVESTTAGNDGSGRDPDPTDPGDFSTAGECGFGQPARNSSWHGTQVAGLIGAATNNGVGIAGAARDVMVLPVRVLGRCGGFDSDIIAAMRWASGLSADVGVGTPVLVANMHPARVINMSLGSSDSCAASYRDVLAELGAAGVSVVVAAGNQDGLAVNTPANCPGAIAVAGVRHIGTKVGYSSVGPEVAIAAPAGNCVNLAGPCLYSLLTTTNAGTTVATDHIYSNSFNTTLGTSFSAPLVAATVGLMLSVNPGLSPSQIKAALQGTARVFPTSGADAAVSSCRAPNGVDQLECYCTTSTCGAGLLNVAAAVAKALEPAVSIRVPNPSPTAGESITLDASASVPATGRLLATFAWTITNGAQSARFSGTTNGPTAVLVATSSGEVTITLSVTDNLGATAVTSTVVTVVAPAAVAAASSGGGAGGWDMLLALACACGVAALQRRKARA